jgi:protein-S-isoprenylcysteine O-methyltransferase Ste14
VHTVDLVVGIGWALFWIYWFAASVGVKPGRIRWRQFAGVRVLVVVLVVGSLHIKALRGQVGHDGWTAGIGLGMFFLGLLVAVWARRHLGRNWGAPQTEKLDPELVTSGPYHWIRNPIYSGLILAMLGTSVAVSWAWLVVAIGAGGYFVYSAVMEQRFMSVRFPDTYPTYRASTKMLIPFVF